MRRQEAMACAALLLILSFVFPACCEEKWSDNRSSASTSSGKGNPSVILAAGLREIADRGKVTLMDDTPAAKCWTPKSNQATLVEITSWLQRATLYHGALPSPQTSSAVVFAANIAPSTLLINTPDHKITIQPFFYLNSEGKAYQKSYLPGVLILNDGGQKTYFQSGRLYDWLKNDQWKNEFSF